MLTDDMQLLSIKNALAGEPLSYPAEYFSGHAAKIAKVIEWAQRTGQDMVKLLEPVMFIDQDVATLIGSIPGNHPLSAARREPPVPLIDQAVEPIHWLYEGYLLRGQINSLVADASTGKTWFGLDLALKVSNGLPWPNQASGVHCQKPGNVLWIDGENFKAGNQARLLSWQTANLFPSFKKFHYFKSPLLGRTYLRDKAMQDEIVRWIEMLNPTLVVFDAWDTLMEKNTFQEDVQGGLDFIDQIAKAYDLCPLVLAHPHKRNFAKPTDPINPDDAAGSRLFKGRSRMMYGMWFHDTFEESKSSDPRIVKVIKNNHKPPKHTKLSLDFKPLHPGGLMLHYLPFDPMFGQDEIDVVDSPYDNKILQAIDSLDEPTNKAISQYLDMNEGVVSRATKKLQREGRIIREGGRNKPWERV